MSMGILVGLAMGWIRRFRDLVQPPIEVLRAVPPLAIAPMLLIWFGPTATTQYVMLIGYTFLAIVIHPSFFIPSPMATNVPGAAFFGASRRQPQLSET